MASPAPVRIRLSRAEGSITTCQHLTLHLSTSSWVSLGYARKRGVGPSALHFVRLRNDERDIWGLKYNPVYLHPRLDHSRGMKLGGILPEDAPDPGVELAGSLKLMPIPVVGLMPQPALEDWDAVGLSYSGG